MPRRLRMGDGMTSQDARPMWFLAQLKPNCAQIADRNLRRQGFMTFLPMEEETRRRQGRFVTVLSPLFPGYIFVAFDMARDFWRRVNATLGVVRVVSFGKDPAPVPPDIVLRLMQRCDSTGRLRPPEGLMPGDHVRLTSGPFTEFVATVEKLASDRRVWVLMDLMGGPSRVAVQVERLRLV